MTLPTALQDGPIRHLTEYLRDELNATIYAIFDAVGEPRQQAVKTAVPWNPDLRAIREWPLLAIYRTECIDFPAGQWRAIARWHANTGTLQVPQQQDYLYWMANNMMRLLEDYSATEAECLRVNVASLRSQISFITITAASPNSDKLTALSFPTVQVNFDFFDTENA